MQNAYVSLNFVFNFYCFTNELIKETNKFNLFFCMNNTNDSNRWNSSIFFFEKLFEKFNLNLTISTLKHLHRLSHKILIFSVRGLLVMSNNVPLTFNWTFLFCYYTWSNQTRFSQKKWYFISISKIKNTNKIEVKHLDQ